ncbi:MAG: SDR family oxidoreductase [Deltaproteobacteria bacterium]|nr:SDR family oxidoreductase [Deltaproteobacteria bacterium]
MSGMFEEKVALVTGSASGIGRATAIAFAREGAKVCVADVDIQGGEETAQLIKRAGGNAIFIKCDVSKASDVEAMVQKTVDTYARLDCAFNNAGVGVVVPTVECTEEQWDLTMNVNLKGVWLCMKYEIPWIAKQGGGAIVNTASAAGLICIQGHSPYTASKTGVIALTKVAALDCASAKIRVNAVCPGAVLTPMLEPLKDIDPIAWNFLQKTTPLGRFAMPEEIAEAVVWLCSDKASYITGVALPVDGGVVSGLLKQVPG